MKRNRDDELAEARQFNPWSGIPVHDDDPETLAAYSFAAAANAFDQLDPDAPIPYRLPDDDSVPVAWDDVIPYRLAPDDAADDETAVGPSAPPDGAVSV